MTREDSQDRTFQERMELAALLPEHDPVRVAVAGEVALHGGRESPAGQEWGRLLGDVERLKRALESVSSPPGLEERLRRIPQAKTTPWWQRPVGEIVPRKVMAAAAAILLIIAAGWWGVTGLIAYRQTQQVQQVAAAAEEVHRALLAHPPTQRIETSDVAAAAVWLKSRVGFQAQMLRSPGMQLSSASVVPLDKAPAVLTTWQMNGHRYSLLQFIPASVGLARDFARRTVDGGGYKVDLWADPQQGCGWALVMDPGTGNPFIY